MASLLNHQAVVKPHSCGTTKAHLLLASGPALPGGPHFAQQAKQSAVLNLRDVAFNEGPAGVANAIKYLWSNVGGPTSRTHGPGWYPVAPHQKRRRGRSRGGT